MFTGDFLHGCEVLTEVSAEYNEFISEKLDKIKSRTSTNKAFVEGDSLLDFTGADKTSSDKANAQPKRNSIDELGDIFCTTGEPNIEPLKPLSVTLKANG